jgi:O-antigen/teichoic acid export membrane protein
VIVARALGPEDRGILSFINISSLFISSIFGFGTSQTFRYFLASKRYVLNEVFGIALITAVLTGFGAGVFLYALWKLQWLGETGNVINSEQMEILFVMCLFSSLSTMISFLLAGVSKFTFTNRGSIFKSLALIVSLWLLVIAFGQGLSGALVGTLISNVVMVGFFIIGLYRSEKPSFQINTQLLRQGMGYSMKTWIGAITTSVAQRLDQFTVGYFLNPKDLGIFSLAVHFSEFILFIPSAADHIYFNKIAQIKGDREKRLFNEQFLRSVSLFVIITGLAFIAIGYFIIPILLGEAYDGVNLFFLLYAPSVILWVVPKFLSKFFAASGKPAYASYITIISVLLMPLFYYPMMHYLGTIGVVVSSNFITGFIILCCFYLYSRMFPGKAMNLINYSRSDLIWLWERFVAPAYNRVKSMDRKK